MGGKTFTVANRFSNSDKDYVYCLRLENVCKGTFGGAANIGKNY